MKIAITSTAPDLDAEMDPRFGRARYLLLVETETLEFEAIENPNIAAGGGAGIQTSQMIAGKGAEAILTGNCGPNAYQTLSAAGVQIYVGLSGPVRQAVEALKRGELQPIAAPSVSAHFGTGMGTGAGRGAGMGRGMGMGRGRGMDASTDLTGPTPGATSPPSREEELEQLKGGAEALKQQLEQMTKRIKELEE